MARFHHAKPLDDFGGVVVFVVGLRGRLRRPLRGSVRAPTRMKFRALVIQQSQVFA